MTVVVSNEVWLAGRAAKDAGEASSANPYPTGSQNSADWLEGYTNGEAEQNQDRPERGEG